MEEWQEHNEVAVQFSAPRWSEVKTEVSQGVLRIAEALRAGWGSGDNVSAYQYCSLTRNLGYVPYQKESLVP